MIWINNLDHFKQIEAWIKHFADDTFKDILSKYLFCILIEILPKFIWLGQIDKMSVLV